MPADAADFFIMRSDPDVMRFIPRPIAVVEADVLPVLKMVEDGVQSGERINWAITLKENDRLIGMIGYVHIKPEHCRAEIGYSLTKSMHRQGIMREALTRSLQYGFEDMQLHTIEAIIDAENRPSGALLESVGFRQEAHYVEDFLHNGVFRNSIHYGMMKREMQHSRRLDQY